MTDWIVGGAGLIGGFSILIFVHELGHYLLAKWNGVRVHVFSQGMGMNWKTPRFTDRKARNHR